MSKQRLDFERIKQEFRIVEVAEQQLGLELHSISGGRYKGKSIFVPGEGDTCTTFYPETNSFYDWKVKAGGSILDLVMQVKFGHIDNDTLYQAAEFLAGDKYEFDSGYWKSIVKQRAELAYDTKEAHDRLMSNEPLAVQTRAYLHERGITDETMKAFGIGLRDMPIQYGKDWIQEPRLFIPYIGINRMPFYAAHRRLDFACRDRNVAEKYKKLKAEQFVRNGILGENTIPYDTKDFSLLIVTEGAIDWLTAVQEGYSSLSSVCGAFGSKVEPLFIKYCKLFRKIITTYDIDANGSGQGFTRKNGMLILKAGMNFYNVNDFGKDNKDLSDFYMSGGKLSELFKEHIINGAVFIAKRIGIDYGNLNYTALSYNEQQKMFADIRELLQTAREVVSQEEFEAVQAEIKKYLPDKELEKALKEPSDAEKILEMRDKFCADYPDLFHYGDSQHGVYYNYDKKAGVWRDIPDGDVHSLVLKRFLCDISNDKVAKITTAVRYLRQREKSEGLPEFNQKSLMNFPNGTLELDTGVFRAHKAEDYMTYSLGFDYDKTADCPLFKKFLNEVMDNNDSRLQSIRDQLGYILYPNCKLQRLFIWYGRGDNGKSTLINVLKDVFDNASDATEYVTAIPLSALTSPTSRIKLMSSLFNTISEISSSLRDSAIAEWLKKISAGDAITGNFKFKDEISFYTRSKMFCLCNEIPTIQDNSDGMRRRLVFIEFVRKFKDCTDADLPEKLRAELPGIFNYIYECYLDLKKRNYIRTCCDQQKLMREFSNNASSVYSFYDSYHLYCSGKTIPTKEIWTLYTNWCRESFIPQNELKKEKNFQTEFLELIEQNGSRRARIRINGKQTLCYVFATLTNTEDNTDDVFITDDDVEAEAVIQDTQQPLPSETYDTELSDTTTDTQPEFSDAELETIDACNKQYNREIVTETVKQLIHEGLQVRTFEHYMKILTEHEAVALEFVFNKLQKFEDAEIAQRIAITKYNARMSA